VLFSGETSLINHDQRFLRSLLSPWWLLALFFRLLGDHATVKAAEKL
jgi:hypothetical protein